MLVTVSKLGPDGQGVSVGDRVLAFCEDVGAFAEQCVVLARRHTVHEGQKLMPRHPAMVILIEWPLSRVPAEQLQTTQ